MSYGFCKTFQLYAFQQCKELKHRLRFDKVAESVKVETF